MSILNNSLLLGADAGGGAGYQISRSLRFNSSDSAYCDRSFTSAGNRKTWTFAAWVKLSALTGTNSSGGGTLFHCRNGTGDDGITDFLINTDGTVVFTGGASTWLTTTQVLRDFSAWYHLVMSVDTTAATASNRLRLYINGSQVTTFNVNVSPTQNSDLAISQAATHRIGGRPSFSQFFNGYLADVHFIDGQALTPSSFTEVSATTGQLIPKAYSGPTPTGNSFWLPFSDNSAATATTLGKDGFLLGNNWSLSNISHTSYTTPNYHTNYTSTFSGGNTYFGDGWIRGFNQNLDDGVFVYSTSSTTLTLPAGVTWSSKIRVRIYGYSPSIIKINGTTLSISYTTGPAWYDVTSQLGTSGTLNTIYIDSAGSNYLAFCAVELDNVVLYSNVRETSDSLVDTPTSYGTDTGAGGEVRGNYATLNPLKKGSNITLTNGNLDASTTLGSGSVHNTIGVSSGKWYWECTLISGSNFMLGIAKGEAAITEYTGQNANSWSYYSANGNKYTNNSTSSYSATYTANDVIGVALDADNGTLTFYKNGVSQGQAYSGLTSGPYFASCSDAGGGSSANSAVFNFGQRPFAYTAPSGFKALCDTNLPAPTIANPSTVMDVKLYTGTGSTQTISGLGFSPDLVWIKSRSAAYNHRLYDFVRGATKAIYSNTTTAETTEPAGLSTFTSTGFNIGSSVGVNDNSIAYVAWTWDAGSSTVTNTQGSITSQVRANASAGFSIVTYTGNVTYSTIGHGLGIRPSLIIVKSRTGATNWAIYHSSLGASAYLYFNTAAVATDNVMWQGVSPTSSVFSVGNYNENNGSNTYVAYCFAPVAGYSAFGSYTGNGSADGPFVYLGFRPRWILFKNSSVGVENWWLHDTARNTYNVMTSLLLPDSAGAEATNTAHSVDALSNGFKIRTNAQGVNGVHTIVYAAFAENPFQYARAR